MKFTLMSYHYLRYPIRKYLDKMERVGLDGIVIQLDGLGDQGLEAFERRGLKAFAHGVIGID